MMISLCSAMLCNATLYYSGLGRAVLFMDLRQAMLLTSCCRLPMINCVTSFTPNKNSTTNRLVGPTHSFFFRRLGELHGTISGGDLGVCRPRAGYDKLPVIIVGGEGDGRQVGGTKPLGFYNNETFASSEFSESKLGPLD